MMKYNLQNKPNIKSHAVKYGKGQRIMWHNYHDAIKKWFEGFEKELREEFRVIDENFPSWKNPTDTLGYGARGKLLQIKEVLGEE